MLIGEGDATTAPKGMSNGTESGAVAKISSCKEIPLAKQQTEKVEHRDAGGCARPGASDVPGGGQEDQEGDGDGEEARRPKALGSHLPSYGANPAPVKYSL